MVQNTTSAPKGPTAGGFLKTTRINDNQELNEDIHILYEVLYVRVCRGISNPNNTYFKIIHKIIKAILQETKPSQRQKYLCVGVEFL